NSSIIATTTPSFFATDLEDPRVSPAIGGRDHDNTLRRIETIEFLVRLFINDIAGGFETGDSVEKFRDCCSIDRLAGPSGVDPIRALFIQYELRGTVVNDDRSNLRRIDATPDAAL